MSRENVEIVKALFAAWKERDAGAAMAHIDPSIELDFTEISFIGQHVDSKSGSAGLQRQIAAWLEAWESLEWIPEDFIGGGGDHVIVPLRVVARGRESKVPVDARVVAVYTLRNGLVVGFRGFNTLAAARTAAGM